MVEIMNDDVKNLFQKFGQTTNSYQEINRDIDSEQAKQRWPLLRDVRVHEAPEDFEQEVEEMIAVNTSYPTMEAGTQVAQPPALKVNGASANASSVFAPSVSPAYQTNQTNQTNQSLFGAKVAATQVEENKVNALFSSRSGVSPSASVASSSKSRSVSDVFKRLVNQDQPAQKAETPVNSFFKKIFRP